MSNLEIRVPPLRERLEDVPAIARHLLERNVPRIGLKVSLSDGAAAKLMQQEYRDNNVRELENVLIHLAVHADTGTIEAADVDRYHAQLAELGRAPAREGDADLLDLPYGHAGREAHARFARRYLRRKLEQAGGVITEAARLAGMHRTAFSTAMRRFRVRDDGDRPVTP